MRLAEGAQTLVPPRRLCFRQIRSARDRARAAREKSKGRPRVSPIGSRCRARPRAAYDVLTVRATTMILGAASIRAATTASALARKGWSPVHAPNPARPSIRVDGAGKRILFLGEFCRHRPSTCGSEIPAGSLRCAVRQRRDDHPRHYLNERGHHAFCDRGQISGSRHTCRDRAGKN